MNVPFAPATMLAPMEGVTNPQFRAIMAERGGIGIVCTEFVRISRAPISAAYLREQVIKTPGVPLSVQIMGNDADRMADAAGIVSEAGADVVDVNMGCPTRQASKNGVGAAMLKDPDLLYSVLSAMRACVPGYLSAKIRAGWDDAAHIMTIVQAIESAGVDFIVVHPRLRTDGFKGTADWRIVAAVKKQVKIPVVGNGDCWYAAHALRQQADAACDGVMIGRPALRNPWIFQQMAQLRAGEPPVHPDGAMLADYVHTTIARFRSTHSGLNGAIGRTKELMGWICRSVNDGRACLQAALRASTIDAILQCVDERISHLPASALDLDSEGVLALERSASSPLV